MNKCFSVCQCVISPELGLFESSLFDPCNCTIEHRDNVLCLDTHLVGVLSSLTCPLLLCHCPTEKTVATNINVVGSVLVVNV